MISLLLMILMLMFFPGVFLVGILMVFGLIMAVLTSPLFWVVFMIVMVITLLM